MFAYIDSVWQPCSYSENAWWEFWKDGGDKLQGAILEARSGLGLAETESQLNFEIVPTSADGNEFVAQYKGQALANQTIGVFTPGGEESEISSNAKGKFTVDLEENGLYLLSSVHTVAGEAQHSGNTVHSLMYITSLTFMKKISQSLAKVSTEGATYPFDGAIKPTAWCTFRESSPAFWATIFS